MTVEAMLDAALKLLKRKGVSSITTNRIAETAGVSIGSLYQYFPNKRAIFIALHERHIAQVDGIMLRRIAESAEVPLEQLISSLIDGMIEAHATDPELSVLLQAEVPHRAEGTRDFSVRLHGDFRRALAPGLVPGELMLFSVGAVSSEKYGWECELSFKLRCKHRTVMKIAEVEHASRQSSSRI